MLCSIVLNSKWGRSMNEMMLREGKGSGLDKSEIKMRIKGRGITFLLVNPSRGPKEKDGAFDPP